MYALKPVRPTSYLAAWTTRRGLQINYECIISTCINLSQKNFLMPNPPTRALIYAQSGRADKIFLCLGKSAMFLTQWSFKPAEYHELRQECA
jgi:hypothetical protein